MILSSDGLYQYFTNEEAVAQVESFIASFPDGDPAQHLIEVVLFRAAKKAGKTFFLFIVFFFVCVCVCEQEIEKRQERMIKEKLTLMSLGYCRYRLP